MESMSSEKRFLPVILGKIKCGSFAQPPIHLPDCFDLKIKTAILLAVCVGLGVLGYVLAGSTAPSASSTPFTVLSGVSVTEIPAKAADLVQAATNRAQTAQEVLRAATTIARPGVLPYVVSAICRRNPEVAETVVATAIRLQPQDVLYFCRAALCAAPGQVQPIVFSACQVLPGSFGNVAMVAFKQLPDARNLILAGLTGALPYVAYYLEQAEVLVGPDDFETLMKQTVQLVTDAYKAQAK